MTQHTQSSFSTPSDDRVIDQDSQYPNAVENDAPIDYWTYRGGKWTFLNKKARTVVEQNLAGRVLNTCAGIVRLNHDDEIIRNDIQAEITVNVGGDRTLSINGSTYSDGDTVPTNADYNTPVSELASEFSTGDVDTIVYDPPWTEHQATNTYSLTNQESAIPNASTIRKLHEILPVGGRFIHASYTPQTLPSDILPQYNVKHISLFNTFGRKKDFYITVAEKQATARHTGANFQYFEADVVPNASVRDIPYETGASASGNEGHPITIRVFQTLGDPTNEPPVASSLSYLLSETAMEVCGYADLNNRAFSEPLRHNGYLIHVATGNRNKSRIENHTVEKPPHDADEFDMFDSDIRLLQDRFMNHTFDSAIVDLPSKRTSTHLSYNGNTKGHMAAALDSINNLIKHQGRVITVMSTATAMPGGLPYIRDEVICFPYKPTESLILTADKKRKWQHIPSEEVPEGSYPFNDVDIETGTSANITCLHCGKENHLPPAYEVDCPTCGQYAGEQCMIVNADVKRPEDAIRPISMPHEARSQQYYEEHQCNCTHDDTGPPERTSEQITNTQVEQKITNY